MFRIAREFNLPGFFLFMILVLHSFWLMTCRSQREWFIWITTSSPKDSTGNDKLLLHVLFTCC